MRRDDWICLCGIGFVALAGFRAWEPAGWAVLGAGMLAVGLGMFRSREPEGGT